MRVFVCWSGRLGNEVAKATKSFVEGVIQRCSVFVSSEDISKGAAWPKTLTEKLTEADFGIVVVTRQSMYVPWVMFEAGSLARAFGDKHVCPLVVDVGKEELKPPLSLFQMATIDQGEMKKLLETINHKCGDDAITQEIFNNAFRLYWPGYKSIIEQALKDNPNFDRPSTPPVETLFRELLLLNMSIAREISYIKTQVGVSEVFNTSLGQRIIGYRVDGSPVMSVPSASASCGGFPLQGSPSPNESKAEPSLDQPLDLFPGAPAVGSGDFDSSKKPAVS